MVVEELLSIQINYYDKVKIKATVSENQEN